MAKNMLWWKRVLALSVVCKLTERQQRLPEECKTERKHKSKAFCLRSVAKGLTIQALWILVRVTILILYMIFWPVRLVGRTLDRSKNHE